jgi:SAM-dependent methyltransferase
MNADLPATHPSVDYYDSDYPGVGTSTLPANLDGMVEAQGLAHDIGRYLGLAADAAGPVLELGCGTGRVAIPLARAGARVTAVDISAAMLARFRGKLDAETAGVTSRIELVQQDMRELTLAHHGYALALIPFNSLMLLTERREQQRALARVAAHLAPGGLVAVDVVNPLSLPLRGDPVPAPFLRRRHCGRDRSYTRFAALGPLDADQRQLLFGWYDEQDELELMLECAGFRVESVEGGHRREPFVATSPKLFVVARKP